MKPDGHSEEYGEPSYGVPMIDSIHKGAFNQPG